MLEKITHFALSLAKRNTVQAFIHSHFKLHATTTLVSRYTSLAGDFARNLSRYFISTLWMWGCVFTQQSLSNNAFWILESGEFVFSRGTCWLGRWWWWWWGGGGGSCLGERMNFIYSSLRALCECCVKVGHGVRVEGTERGRESLSVWTTYLGLM